REILNLSRATDWETARKEWALTEIYEADEDETCLCEHFPIREICVIRNTVTGLSTEVGNVCVKRFLGIRSDLIFAAIKRIKSDLNKILNTDSAVFFFRRGIITAWEYSFLQNTARKRSPTAKQMAMRISINRKVLATIAKRGLKG